MTCRVATFASEPEARAIGMGVLPDAVVARRLGVTRQRIFAIRARFGIPAPDTGRTRREKLLEELAKSCSCAEAARSLALPYSTTAGMARRLGLTFARASARGRPSKALSGDVLAAVQKAGTHAGAARLLNVHPSTVSQAVRRFAFVERGLLAPAVRRPKLVVVSLRNLHKMP
jgi:hypothetical protein